MNVPEPWKTIPRTSHGPMNLWGESERIISSNLLHITQDTDLDRNMHIKAPEA
jgi:hypothetical protein